MLAHYCGMINEVCNLKNKTCFGKHFLMLLTFALRLEAVFAPPNSWTIYAYKVVEYGQSIAYDSCCRILEQQHLQFTCSWAWQRAQQQGQGRRGLRWQRQQQRLQPCLYSFIFILFIFHYLSIISSVRCSIPHPTRRPSVRPSIYCLRCYNATSV